MRKHVLFALNSLLIIVGYFALAELSLQLVLGPGSAALVWFPAGLSLVALLLGGYKYIPATFIGAFFGCALVDVQILPLFKVTIGGNLYPALMLASGTTLQAMFACTLVRRFMPQSSLPPSGYHDMFSFLLLAGGLASVVSATVGNGALYFNGYVAFDGIVTNYLFWWVGDAVGVALFAPIFFLVRNQHISMLRKFIVVVPTTIFALLVGVAFFAAKESLESKNLAKVERDADDLSRDIEKDLQTYLNLLVANERFILSSEYVSDEEFKFFTQKFFQQFNGIAGMGWLPRVEKEDKVSHEEEIRGQGYPDYQILDRGDDYSVAPAEERSVYFPAAYVRPYGLNKGLHGVDISALTTLKERGENKTAIEQAIATKEPRATGRFPIGSASGEYGFAIFHPVFLGETGEVAQRKLNSDDLLGFCAGVFVVSDVLNALNQQAQALGLDVILTDQVKGSSHATVLFDSRTKNYKEGPPVQVKAGAVESAVSLDVAGRIWHLRFIQKNPPSLLPLSLLLLSGLIVSICFCIFLLWLSGHMESVRKGMAQEEEEEKGVSAYVLASIAIGISLLFTLSSAWEFQKKERESVDAMVMEEMNLMKQAIYNSMNESITALNRMARRWEVSGGTPEDEWRDDAQNYVKDLAPLKTVEWVDADYYIRWAEPVEGNEAAIGYNIAFTPEHTERLEKGRLNKEIVFTPPMDLLQGYRAFITYIPIHIQGSFHGFIVGIYNMQDFIASLLTQEQMQNFYILIRDENKVVFENNNAASTNFSVASELHFSEYDRSWSIIVSPQEGFVSTQRSYLGYFMEGASILFSMLIGFAVYTAIISHQRSKLIQRKQDALRESEAKMQAIMNNTADGLLTTDLKGYVQSYSKSCESIFGYSADEIMYKNVKILLPHPEELLSGDVKLEDLKPQDITGLSKDIEVRRKDGTLFPAEVSISQVHTADGMLYSAIVRDVTDRKKLIDSLMDSNEELERFAYVCSHDLQEPLRMVYSFTERLKENLSELVQKDEKVERYMNYVTDGAKRAQELIQDILAYSRLDKDMQRHEEVDLNALVELITDTLQVSLTQRGGTITKDELPVVMGNRTQLYQVLQNLISNGLKYHEPDNIPEVHIGARAQDGMWEISVKDNGIGMEERHLVKIFDIFQRLHRRDEFPGTGVGLSICKKIVERHDGKIWAESKKGEGSTFIFTLPQIKEGETSHE